MTTETPIDDEVLTIDEAAAILRISRNAAVPDSAFSFTPPQGVDVIR